MKEVPAGLKKTVNYKLIKPISQGCFSYIQPGEDVILREVQHHNFELRENTKLYKVLSNKGGEAFFMFTDEQINDIAEKIELSEICRDCSHFQFCTNITPKLEICSGFLKARNRD